MNKTLETCAVEPVKTEWRNARRFIPYCAGVGYGGVIVKGARECKAKDCFNYRELKITDEPEGYNDDN